MPEDDRERLEQHLDRLENALPNSASNWVAWIRRPRQRLARLPLALLLIFGGIFSILPVLGAWMLPLGLMLLAIDVPFLQRPVNAAISWGERNWHRFRRWLRKLRSREP